MASPTHREDRLILLAHDGSVYGDWVARYALHFARHEEDRKLLVLHVPEGEIGPEIVAGIEEGRTVFANIHTFTNYVLVSNGPEILPNQLYIVLPAPLCRSASR